MGMAASQARYLALVARKSNCEYEGQQINQARLALSNQSANLFNQMLGLKVPVPPSTQDYTKTQYSFTDGINAYTIDKWNQLAQPDSEGYNYVVDYHYKANVYTGSQKQLSDPQVQFTRSASEISPDYTADVIKIQKALQDIENAQKTYDEAADAYKTAYAKSRTLSTYTDNNLYSRVSGYTHSDDYSTYTVTYGGAQTKTLNDGISEKDYVVYNYADSPYTNKTYYSLDGVSYGIEEPAGTFKPVTLSPDGVDHAAEEDITLKYGNDVYTKYNDSYWSINGTNFFTMGNDGKLTAAEAPETPVISKYDEAGPSTITIGDTTYEIHADGDTWYYKNGNKYYTLDSTTGLAEAPSVLDSTTGMKLAEKQENFNQVIYNDSLPPKTRDAIDWLILADDTITVNDFYQDEDGNLVLQRDLRALVDGQGHGTSTILPTYHIEGTPPGGQNWKSIDTMKTELNVAQFAMATAQEVLDNAKAYYDTLNVPDYIGNNQLTPLTELTDAQQSEIKQIIKDMTDQDVSTTLSKYFDIKTNEYMGGIYQFTLNGITYYATYDDMADSIKGGTGINNIDDQPKLPYYRADYISQNINKQEKAVLETDSSGRFVSIRLGDDTVKYTLNVETITDDVAYEDAMNKYYYENAKYDKMVQDINAKTSIIQVEDRTLELRLKQLDTEQNALTQEMEAVQKVVKSNVEKSFKTFGG